MEKAAEETDRRHPVNPEAKWIRLQEIGLAQLFATPVALLLAAAVGLKSFAGICLIIAILIVSGCCCLRIGSDERRKLQDEEDNQCSKCP